jgi:transcriptional regulator with XRE-family HTH domain
MPLVPARAVRVANSLANPQLQPGYKRAAPGGGEQCAAGLLGALTSDRAVAVAVMGPTRRRHSERVAGNLLRLARAKRGWSQRQLTAAAGVAPSTVARIASGSSQPTLPTLGRVLAAADLDLRTRLEPYDEHDDVLDATRARMTPEQRANDDQEIDEFIARLRAGATVAC